MSSNPDSGEPGLIDENGLVSRRKLVVLGATALLGGMIALAFSIPKLSESRDSKGTEGQSAGQAKVQSTSDFGTVRVKAVYFQMAQTVPVDHEYYDIASPATVAALTKIVQSEYPQLANMMLSMSILVDGQVATGSTLLHPSDEVDFVPMLQGG